MANLAALLKEPRIGGAKGLAELLGRPKMRAHLLNIRDGRRGMGDALAADIEDVTGKGRGWMDRQHTVAGESPPPYSVAHAVSLPDVSDALPLYRWEDIMLKETPDTFRAALVDDALAPQYPRGTEIVWTTRRRAAPGRLVLVRDAHGQLHARQFRQSTLPGRWIAAALNPAFATLEDSDSLHIVAVYKGVLEPDDY